MNDALHSVLNAGWEQHAVTAQKRKELNTLRDEFLALAMANAVTGVASSEQVRVWLVQAQTIDTVLGTVFSTKKA